MARIKKSGRHHCRPDLWGCEINGALGRGAGVQTYCTAVMSPAVFTEKVLST